MNKATRVRYKMNGNTFVSTQSFLGNNGSLLKVSINVKNPTVTILKVSSTGDDEVVVSKPCSSIGKCKTLGKVLLKEYGVNFFDEARKRIVT